MIYVSGLALDASSPTSLAQALLSAGLPELLRGAPSAARLRLVDRAAAALPPLAAGAIRASDPGMGASLRLADVARGVGRKLLGPKGGPARAMQQALDALREALDAWDETVAAGKGTGAQQWPVIIIDEANVLSEWAGSHPQDVKTIARFLVQISKEQNRCHVILASSNYTAMQEWLDVAIGPGSWLPAVVGDFPEGTARAFLEWELRERGSSTTPVSGGAWARIYEVCGGNAGDLKRLASLVDMPGCSGDWDAAIEEIVTPALLSNERLALGGDGWTTEHYAAAALKLLDSELHVVPQWEMQAMLGRLAVGATGAPGASKAAEVAASASLLRQMVGAGALSVRPRSAWARDIPVEAFRGRCRAVVTAPSALDLYCMGLMREQLEHEPLVVSPHRM